MSRGIFSHGSGMGVAPFFPSSECRQTHRGRLHGRPHPGGRHFVGVHNDGPGRSGLWRLDVGDRRLPYSQRFQPRPRAHWFRLGECLFAGIRLYYHRQLGLIYSEKCFTYLGGKRLLRFRWFFVGATFAGPFFPVSTVWAAADIVVGLMLALHVTPLTAITLAPTHATETAARARMKVHRARPARSPMSEW